MKRYDNDFLEKTDVKNILEHIKTKGLSNLESYDVNSITDEATREFFDSMLEFSADYVNNETPKNYTRARTDLFKKRYDKFLMCYEVLLKNELVTPELEELKKYYENIIIKKIEKLQKEIENLPAEKDFEKQKKLESLGRLIETLKLSKETVALADEHKPLFEISQDEFEKLKNGSVKQKQEDDKKLEDVAVVIETPEAPKKDEFQNIQTISTGGISLDSMTSQKQEKKSMFEKRLESLKMQLIPEEEIQKLKQETEVLFENINKATKEGSNPQVINELYAKYKESKADLELALDNNEKVNKKIARLEGAKKIASMPRKEFNKLKTNAKLKAAEIKKQIHDKMDPIVEGAKEKVNDAKDFVVEKATNAKDFVVDKATDAKDFVVDKANDVKDFASDKLETATKYVSDKKDEITEKIVTGYNNVGEKLQNKVDDYSKDVKSQEQLSSDAISEALSQMGNETSISQIDNAVDKITKEAAKDSKKAARKVALLEGLQKLHSIPKALKDKLQSKTQSIGEEQMTTGRAI